jgi:hypothetical protein
MSIRGNWPMGTRCEVEAGGAAGNEVEPPQDTAPIPPEPEQAEAAKKRRQMARSHRACRFMAFSVYLPEPIRSSVASAITLVALNEVVDSTVFIRLMGQLELARAGRDAVRCTISSAARSTSARMRSV